MTLETWEGICVSVKWVQRKRILQKAAEQKEVISFRINALDFKHNQSGSSAMKICEFYNREVRDTDGFRLKSGDQKNLKTFTLSISWLCLPMSWHHSQKSFSQTVAKLFKYSVKFTQISKLREKDKHYFPNSSSTSFPTVQAKDLKADS